MTRRAAVATLSESPVSNSRVPRFELAPWRAKHGVIAGITGSAGGFDLGLSCSDSMSVALGRWQALREEFKREFSGFAVSRQHHGTEIGTYRHPVAGLLIAEGLDGHTTRVPGLALGVTVADCIPIYLVDPRSRELALLHAGWRGVSADILERGIERICGSGVTAVADLIMHCGVGICGECYEVGGDVYRTVTGKEAAEPALLDLRGVLIERARSLGVEQISTSGWCSAHDSPQFHSHRASGGVAGRMLAYIGWPVT